MSNYGIVTRAFPADYWTAHGDEILDTANELHDGNWSARESRSLLAHGLRTRSLAATGGSLRQMWIQCTILVLTISTLAWTTTAVADQFGLVSIELEGTRSSTAILGVVLLVLLSRSSRWIAALPVVWLVSLVVATNTTSLSWMRLAGLTALCAWAAWKSEGRRPLSAPTMLLLAAVHTAALLVDVYLFGFLPIVLLVVGLFTFHLEPRVLGCVAVSSLLIIVATFEAYSQHSPGDLALIFGTIVTVTAVATLLTIRGSRRLQRVM